MDKKYQPLEIEERLSKHWAETPLSNRKNLSTFAQVIPPPNVTGTLHMGHSFQYAIMDFYSRYNFLNDKNVFWQMGTDHAGIATQLVVENRLLKKGETKETLGREKFLDEVWDWKEKSEANITSQIKRLGCSVDWNQYRFTLDEKFSESVTEAFVKLYRDKKIYRGYRLVNWDPSLQTAVSDLEVVRQEKIGKIWHISYPIEDSSDSLIIATTRPETMLGDTAVAVNPNDERYKHLVGKYIILPIVGREIPIITDKYVDPKFGTGCVKVTPAHDPNDFQIGQRHDLELINIMNDDASMNSNVPDKYVGLSREKARKEVVEDIQKKGFLEKIENYQTKIGFSERGQVPIEFYLSEQWFMKMEHLVKPAIDAVNKGKINFYPKHWSKTYNHWLLNIKDWCISCLLYTSDAADD